MFTKSTPREESCVIATSRGARIAATFRLQVARDEQQRREMGARIKELREANGLKQETIAEACGVRLRTYQMWQAGDVTPGQGNLEKLAELFHVTPKFLLRGDTPEPLLAAPVVDDTSARILERLEAIQTQLDQIALDNEARQAELISHIDERTEPTQAAPQRRRRA